MPVANTVSRNPLADDDELLYTGKVNGEIANLFPMPVTRGCSRAARSATHFLHALPRPHGQGRRHDRAARHAPAAVVHAGSPSQGAGGVFLRRDDQRLWRDAGLRRADSRGRSLGHRRPTSARCNSASMRRSARCPTIAAPISTGLPRRPPATPPGRRPRDRRPPLLRPPTSSARRSRALLVGLAGLVGCGVGFAINRDQFFRAWLIAYMLWLGVTLGIDGAHDDPPPVGRHRGGWWCGACGRRRAGRCR